MVSSYIDITRGGVGFVVVAGQNSAPFETFKTAVMNSMELNYALDIFPPDSSNKVGSIYFYIYNNNTKTFDTYPSTLDAVVGDGQYAPPQRSVTQTNMAIVYGINAMPEITLVPVIIERTDLQEQEEESSSQTQESDYDELKQQVEQLSARVSELEAR